MPKAWVRISGPGMKNVQEMLEHSITSRTQLYDIILQVFKVQAPKAAAHVIKTQLSGRVAPAYGPNKQVKKRRTGNLARSIHGRGVMHEGRPTMEVGLLKVINPVVSKYAWTQEFGTTSENPSSPVQDITPKRARAMTVPVGRNLTPAGVTRRTISEFAKGELQALMFRSPRGRYGHVIGRLVLKTEFDAERSAAIAEGRSPDFRVLEPMFLLMTKVRIKPGWYLNDGLRDYLPTIVNELAQALAGPMIGKRRK